MSTEAFTWGLEHSVRIDFEKVLWSQLVLYIFKCFLKLYFSIVSEHIFCWRFLVWNLLDSHLSYLNQKLTFHLIGITPMLLRVIGKVDIRGWIKSKSNQKVKSTKKNVFAFQYSDLERWSTLPSKWAFSSRRVSAKLTNLAETISQLWGLFFKQYLSLFRCTSYFLT